MHDTKICNELFRVSKVSGFEHNENDCKTEGAVVDGGFGGDSVLSSSIHCCEGSVSGRRDIIYRNIDYLVLQGCPS